MLADCEAGKIDIILTKSISRFARNTVDLLETVRRLKDLGVEVRFEKERIRSMDGDGELMLTILASFAQEESRSISDNVKWGIRKRMQNGIPNGHFRIYGYRWEGDELVIVPDITERRTRMIELGDVFIAFPGGTGTLEEVSEVVSKICLNQLSQPCIFYNLNGFYDDMKAFLQRMINVGFSTSERQHGIYFASNLTEIEHIIATHQA